MLMESADELGEQASNTPRPSWKKRRKRKGSKQIGCSRHCHVSVPGVTTRTWHQIRKCKPRATRGFKYTLVQMDRRHNANALAFGGVNDVNVVNDALTHLCSMFEDVRRCSKMFEDVRRCSNIFSFFSSSFFEMNSSRRSFDVNLCVTSSEPPQVFPIFLIFYPRMKTRNLLLVWPCKRRLTHLAWSCKIYIRDTGLSSLIITSSRS